ncbi:MAG: hypothetical protein A2017_03280 [Lentisphaerae bacterium GWF2_44_16]|nr:MAG: hypothetical protein A2017_03280 [Lentisphaerae bacterium GWF2_44_16]
MQATDLIRLELVKNIRQKYFLAGSGLILFYTVLSCLGFITHRLINKNNKFDGIFISELMNGITFSMYCLVPGIYMLMPMILAIFTASSLAGEFQNGQLRTTLLRPVSRWKIFLCKFISMGLYSFTMFAILLTASYLLGAIIFAPSGDVIILGQVFLGENSIFILKESIALQRMLMSYALAFFSSIYLVAMYMMVAALTKKVAHTIVVSLGVYYTSYILLSIPFMKYIHPFLPTKYLAVWRYPVIENIPWERLTYDILIDTGYMFAYIVVGVILFNNSDV